MLKEMTQLYKKLHAELAIHGEVKLKLPEILPLLRKGLLSHMAAYAHLPGRSKMSKQELAGALPPSLAAPSAAVKWIGRV